MDDWLLIKLEEYKSTRTESLDAGNNAQALLKFGVAAIGIVIGSGINLWNNDILSALVFLLFTPLLSYLILIMWIGEFARRMRVSIFIAEEIEKK